MSDIVGWPVRPCRLIDDWIRALWVYCFEIPSYPEVGKKCECNPSPNELADEFSDSNEMLQ